MIAEATIVLMIFRFEEVGVGTLAVSGPVGSVGGIDGELKDALTPAEGGTMGGDELRVRSVDERRAFSCII